MKLQFRQIEPFVKNPDKAARVILIYGPDDGLMRERSKLVSQTVVKDLNDPFNVAVLSSDILVEDPARLNDEANAISMLGGSRLIRVENASDKITTFIKQYLENPNPESLVVLEAGELTPRSSLRLLCEKHDKAAALPCYVEDERDLTRLIRETLQTENIRAEPDAVTWLSTAIVGDRARARSEIEKLIIYKGKETTPLTLEEAQAACGDSGAQDLDDLVYSVAGRQAAKALNVYNHLIDEGVSFVPILRALQSHFRRLHITKARIEQGADTVTAMKSLNPQVFFKQEAAFKGQLQNWSIPSLDKVLTRLLDLEAECKKTNIPTETLCAQAMLGIGSMRG
jgi:DNA polymerase III subunit delta